MTLAFHTSPLLSSHTIPHGFFTRLGGVSQGVFESLNCGLGSGDNLDAVHTNHARIAEALGRTADGLVTLYQCHTTLIHPVTKDMIPSLKGVQGDGSVTTDPHVTLGVLTADCGPVLLADPVANIASAVHAGWKGAHGGILGNAVSAMVELGASPSRILAAIGPCIGKQSYQVQEDMRQKFLLQDPSHTQFFISFKDRYTFDLRGYIATQLRIAGVTQIDQVGGDTYAEPDTYFSYRRNSEGGIKEYGRLLSAIGAR